MVETLPLRRYRGGKQRYKETDKTSTIFLIIYKGKTRFARYVTKISTILNLILFFFALQTYA